MQKEQKNANETESSNKQKDQATVTKGKEKVDKEQSK